MRRAKALAPIVVMLFGVARLVLGLRRRGTATPGSAQRKAFDPQAHVAGIRVVEPIRLRRGSTALGLALVLVLAGGVYAGYQLKFDREAHARAIALTAGEPRIGAGISSNAMVVRAAIPFLVFQGLRARWGLPSTASQLGSISAASPSTQRMP